jgi:hypothetical protein
LLFLNLLLFLFSNFRREVKFATLFFSITTILFYSYSVHIEARYALAIYPFLYFMLVCNLSSYSKFFLKKN